MGGPVRVAAAPAAEILRRWRAAGFSDNAMSTYLRVTQQTVYYTAAGTSRVIHRDLAARVEAMTAADIYELAPRGALVPAVGAARRVQALAALGWPIPGIETCTSANGYHVLDKYRRGDRVTAGVWRRIAGLYDARAMTPGPSRTTETRSRRRGWAPPFAWDPGTIDDPDAVADLGEEVLTPTEAWIEDVRELREIGVPVARILAQTGTTSSVALARLRRHAPDLVAPFSRHDGQLRDRIDHHSGRKQTV